MKRTVRVLARARQDVDACYLFLSQRSPQGAANWFNRFVETRDRLMNDAQQRPLAPESRFVGYDIREVLFKTRKGNPYRVLFMITGDEVLVLRVRGPGQDLLAADDLGAGPDDE